MAGGEGVFQRPQEINRFLFVRGPKLLFDRILVSLNHLIELRQVVDELALEFGTFLRLYKVLAELAHTEGDFEPLIIYLEIVGTQNGDASFCWG